MKSENLFYYRGRELIPIMESIIADCIKKKELFDKTVRIQKGQEQKSRPMNSIPVTPIGSAADKAVMDQLNEKEENEKNLKIAQHWLFEARRAKWQRFQFTYQEAIWLHRGVRLSGE